MTNYTIQFKNFKQQAKSRSDSPTSSTSGHYSDSTESCEGCRTSSPNSSINSENTDNSVNYQKSERSKAWNGQNLGATLNTNQLASQLQHSFTSSDYARLSQMALQAMARPVLGPEIQTPTNKWVGLGFSRSMNSAQIAR